MLAAVNKMGYREESKGKKTSWGNTEMFQMMRWSRGIAARGKKLQEQTGEQPWEQACPDGGPSTWPWFDNHQVDPGPVFAPLASGAMPPAHSALDVQDRELPGSPTLNQSSLGPLQSPLSFSSST